MTQVIWIDFSLEMSPSATVKEWECLLSASVSKPQFIVEARLHLLFLYVYYTGTHYVQDITYNIQSEPVTVTIDYIENTEALGALLALMYLDQDGNIVCSKSIYAAIRRSEDDFPLPMGDPDSYSYLELVYGIIESNGLEDKAAVKRHNMDIGKV